MHGSSGNYTSNYSYQKTTTSTSNYGSGNPSSSYAFRTDERRFRAGARNA